MTSAGQVLEDFKTLFKIKRKQFDTKFEAIFGLNQARFENDKTLKQFKNGLKFSKEALANLLGGIGYYYGPIKIKGSGRAAQDEYDGKFAFKS